MNKQQESATQATREHLMDNIDALWRTNKAQLDGYLDADGISEPIDRDQAVDDDGRAIYDRYTLSIELGDGYTDNRRIVIPFNAEAMEAYARTW